MTNPKDLRKGIDDMKVNTEAMCDGLVHVAAMTRTYFEALVKEGFTEEQALEIIKARGITL